MDVGFARFFKQYLLLICLNQTASALFRFIGSLGRNIIVANTFGSFALLAVMVLGGFIMSRGNNFDIDTSIYIVRFSGSKEKRIDEI